MRFPRTHAIQAPRLLLSPFLSGLLAVLVMGLLVVGCETPQPAPSDGSVRLESASLDEILPLAANLRPYDAGLASWRDMAGPLRESLDYLSRRPRKEIAATADELAVTWGQLHDSALELLGMLPALDHRPSLLAERFSWLAVRPRTLLTGYYEPWMEASSVRTDEYPYPLYGKPPDLKTVDLGLFSDKLKGERITYRVENDEIRPYFARKDIDFGGAIQEQDVAVAWAKCLVDIFVLQIQGSGRLIYPDGSVRHILYEAQNGHRYVSLGRVLIDRGHLGREGMSMQRIRAFLKENEHLAPELLSANPSYVFFKIGEDGPYGAMGRVITPMVSVAVDRSLVPLGAVLALDTTLPQSDGGVSRFQSLVLAQDTGGAIKGTRCDLFCGSDGQAEFLAGHLQNEARLFVLVSKAALRPWEYRGPVSR